MNVLLLDPHPELMVNAIVRTGCSVFVLHEAHKLTVENTIRMFSTVISALEVLANICHTAVEAIPLLQNKMTASGINLQQTSPNDILDHAMVSMTGVGDYDLFRSENALDLNTHADFHDPLERSACDIDVTMGTVDDDIGPPSSYSTLPNWEFDVNVLTTRIQIRC